MEFYSRNEYYPADMNSAPTQDLRKSLGTVAVDEEEISDVTTKESDKTDDVITVNPDVTMDMDVTMETDVVVDTDEIDIEDTAENIEITQEMDDVVLTPEKKRVPMETMNESVTMATEKDDSDDHPDGDDDDDDDDDDDNDDIGEGRKSRGKMQKRTPVTK